MSVVRLLFVALVAEAVLQSLTVVSGPVLAALVPILIAVSVTTALLADALPRIPSEPARPLRAMLAVLSSALLVTLLAAVLVAAHAGRDVPDHLGEASLIASAAPLALSIPSLLAEVLAGALPELPRIA